MERNKAAFDAIMEKCNGTNASGREIFTVSFLDEGDVVALYDVAPDWEAVVMPRGDDMLSVADRIFWLADIEPPEDTDEEPDAYYDALVAAVEELRATVEKEATP